MSLIPSVFQNFKHVLPSQMSSMRKHILILLVLVMSSFIFSAIIFTFFEGSNGHISNFEDFMWWWIVATSTVGYGDIVLQTV